MSTVSLKFLVFLLLVLVCKKVIIVDWYKKKSTNQGVMLSNYNAIIEELLLLTL